MLGVLAFINQLRFSQSETPQKLNSQYRLISPGATNVEDLDDDAILNANSVETFRSTLALSKQGAFDIRTTGISCQYSKCAVELRYLTSGSYKFWLIKDPNSIEKSQIGRDKIKASAAGLSIEIGENKLPATLVGAFVPTSVRPIETYIWDDYSAIDTTWRKFERNGGLLTGSLIALALFSLFVAVMNKDLPFLVLAGWMVGALRLASFNGGWGLEWFEFRLSPSVFELIRRTTLCMQGVLGASLYYIAFKSKLRKYEFGILQTFAASFVAFTFVAPFLSMSLFSILYWGLTAVAMLATFFVAFNQACREPKLSVLLFLVSWGVFISGAIIEIVYSSGLISSRLSLLNIQTSAVFSGFFLVITLANRMQEERAKRVQAEKEKNKALANYKDLFANSPVGLVQLEVSGEITEFNPAAAKLLGIDPHSTQRHIEHFLPRASVKRLIKSSGEVTEVRTGDGDASRWVAVRCIERNGVLEASISDITTRKQAEEKLRYIADHDQLTGVWNRNWMIAAIEGQLNFAKELDNEFSGQTDKSQALMIDLDRFNQIVTFFGHKVGDEVLIEVKDRLVAATDNQLLLGRLSADNFIAIVPVESHSHGQELMDKVLACVNDKPFRIAGNAVYVSASVGLVELAGFEDPRLVLAACDLAVQDAKASGGRQGRILDTTEPLWKNHKEKLGLMKAFSAHIPFERMEMHLQPVVAFQDTQASVSYEALLRLRQPDGKMSSPAVFIPALEESGLMSRIDYWVVSEVFKYLNAQPAHLDRLRYCAINLSGASLNDPNATQALIALVKANHHIANKVCFEITESIAVMDFELAKSFVNRLKAQGCHVALDDFGAGYSSFSYLAAIKADVLKIDGSLVKGLKTTPEGESVIRSITELAHSFNMKVVAEWVENCEIAADLIRLGVDYGQGWALCKPMPMDTAKQWHTASDFLADQGIRDLLGVDRSTSSGAANSDPLTAPQTAAPNKVLST